jgi:GT2 family glycosyltransferase
MDADRWRAEQRKVRELLRSRTGGQAQSTASSTDDPAAPADGSTPLVDDRIPLVDRRAPLASVIVVCWNAAAVLERCLDRLLEQDYPNYEVIVVDDGSDDDTPAVAGGVSSRAPRAGETGAITVLRSAGNRGVTHGRNLGLENARGEIVAFIDADGFAAPDWLRRIVEAFDEDATIGGVASTVFFDANPLVINGAGGIVNRQGWAADLSMNEPYEFAQIASETLYPMGCGMALRRSALERVGPFDERMINYYDDVDYGTRLWRAGYRVVVASEAWVDHGFGQAGGIGQRGGDSARKQLLCERHRMRVVLKHASNGVLVRWALQEARTLKRATASRRMLKLRAIAWNARHLPSALAARRQLGATAPISDRLFDLSWGDGFPVGVPPLLTPRPETACRSLDMADPVSREQLIYGWFPAETVDKHSYRWAGERAAVLIHLDGPAKLLRLDYAHVPLDTGGIDLDVRPVGAPGQLTPAWSTHLPWQYIARSIENHPLALDPGDYEVLFRARRGWSDVPRDTRSLGFALASMSFEESLEIAEGGLRMDSSTVERQLVRGWLEAEQGPTRSYRWAGASAAALVRLTVSASGANLSYCLPPGSIGSLQLSMRRLDSDERAWSTRISWRDGEWREQQFPLELAPGDYLVSFEAETTWSNPEGRDPTFWGENRSLGFALSALRFGSGR